MHAKYVAKNILNVIIKIFLFVAELYLAYIIGYKAYELNI